MIAYNDITVDKEINNLSVDHYHNNGSNGDVNKCKITFDLFQKSYKVNLKLLYSTFQGLTNATGRSKAIIITLGNGGRKQNSVLIKSCQFIKNYGSLIDIRVIDGYFDQHYKDIIQFDMCHFLHNYVGRGRCGESIIKISTFGPSVVLITNCNFHNNNYRVIYKRHNRFRLAFSSLKVIIANTTFSSAKLDCWIEYIKLSNVELHLIGPVVFYNISSNLTNVIYLRTSNITCINHIEFAMINANSILEYRHYQLLLFVKENFTFNISHNKFIRFATVQSFNPIINPYPPCFIQYLNEIQLDNEYSTPKYSIIFENNDVTSAQHAYNNLRITHCRWLPQSALNTAMPLEVNKKVIKYINSSGTFDSLPQLSQKKTICYCNTNTSYDCYKDILDPIYPGQTMTLRLYMDVNNITGFESPNIIITIVNDVDWLPPTACVVTNYTVQTAKSHTCNSLQYSVSFPNENWCELFLKSYSDGSEKVDIYYINQRPCPAGFIKLDGRCQCYPFLKRFNIKCDIDNQVIIRPSQVWVLPIRHGKRYVYKISLQCPFHYCLPHSSQLNFSTPNSQCQFNRSGILCGQCQQGLSTVFGSPHCQQCSNIYLFLIVPIAIAGLVLVILLFILNLTVTDGTISAFILYVNIISINIPVFFPQLNKFTPAYIFISLANLDLGIQTCFYNGMDDYAKMWLQLAFPFYLIFIATSLIITSRYSTTIQRLTARRALPVLATLFLLSYTKVLLVISSVLFSYSTIIHLPNEQTTLQLIWSVDANITLLGVKFIALYITCLILFLMLIPFNVILLFTRTFSRFQYINKFRPLLDAYQGPYKIKFYYWAGVQLLLRIVVFGISSLDKDTNLTIGIILLSILAGYHGTVHPFKNAVKNYQELVLILNLQVMYTISLYGRESVTSIILNLMITMAAVHFMFIVLYHIITYMHGGVIRQMMMLNINKVTRCLNSLLRIQQVQQFELENLTRDRIPEVTHHYDQFQEPLVGQSY
ncbi:uncharacterized protein [Dysidea avara]|uniref:uncharacterized protein n=1 Tax=Dysidea avara TaxID=196820 RepID=UPI00332A2337